MYTGEGKSLKIAKFKPEKREKPRKFRANDEEILTNPTKTLKIRANDEEILTNPTKTLKFRANYNECVTTPVKPSKKTTSLTIYDLTLLIPLPYHHGSHDTSVTLHP